MDPYAVIMAAVAVKKEREMNPVLIHYVPTYADGRAVEVMLAAGEDKRANKRRRLDK